MTAPRRQLVGARPERGLAALTVVSISGHRQPAVADSADFRSWTALAGRVGRAVCLWAGPPLDAERDTLLVRRRPRRPGPRSLLWVAGSVRVGVRATRAAGRRGEEVVVNGGEPWGWLSAWLVAELTGRPWLMDLHADYLGLPTASVGRWRRAVLERAVLYFARRAGARRVVAQSMVDSLGRLGLPAELVPPRLQPVWQDPPERRLPPFAVGCAVSTGGTGGPVLLAVGRLVASKGYDLLLAAMADLRADLPGVRLRIVGDGPELVALTTQADRLGLGDTVTFLGAGGVAEVRAELATADLFVISSRDEGLPRTLLEAASALVPVLATTVGGIPAAAAGWPTVTLVAVTPSALADGVRRVTARPPDPDELARVRGQVLERYSFAANLDALADLYRRVGTG